MLRSFRWIESYSDKIIVVSEVRWGWIGLCTGVCKVQSGVNPIELDSVECDFLVDEFDWNGNMFDSGCDCVGFEGVDTWLTVNIEGKREDIGWWVTDVGIDVL